MSTTLPLGLSKIGQIAIPVQDLARAVRFYRDTLELPFLFQAPPGLAFFQCGGVRLMLTLPEENQPASQSAPLYYQVADLDQAYATLRVRQVDLIDAPHLVAKLPDHELWMFFLRDSEGNLVALMSEVRQEAG
ncbi:MAG: VOC family protein [Caldilineaceae bacterium]|nr:VOC family protein [Caldilineaceae bacterium]